MVVLFIIKWDKRINRGSQTIQTRPTLYYKRVTETLKLNL